MSARRRKVLIIHHSGLLGGAGRSLEDVVCGLSSDFDITVHLPSRPNELCAYLLARGIEVATYDFRMAKVPYYSGGEPLWHPRFWFYVASIPRQWRYWRQLIQDESPDVIIVNSSVIAWVSLLASGRLSVLMVRETLRGRANSVANRLLRKLRERFSLVAYLSDYDRESDHLASAATALVPDAANPSDFGSTVDRAALRRQLALDESMRVGLFLGGSNPLKGLDLLLEAMPHVASIRLHVIVAGQAPRAGRRMLGLVSPHRRFDRRVLKLLAQPAVRDRVTFVGVTENVAALYGASDFVVFPMLQPHQARPAFEAGFQGKPIVISDFPNIRACVEDDINGLTFEPGDPHALALRLERLADDDALASRLGLANLAHAMAMHDHEVVFDKLRRLLRGSLDELGSVSSNGRDVDG